VKSIFRRLLATIAETRIRTIAAIKVASVVASIARSIAGNNAAAVVRCIIEPLLAATATSLAGILLPLAMAYQVTR
jgi:hypothetical protein